MKRRRGLGFLRSFGYAFWGVGYALARERNLRIHFVAGAFALYLSRYYAFSRAELGLLIACVGLVIVCEMLNTAIEKTVDIEIDRYHSLAKIAKDVAAGAVLVSAATSLAVGFLLFWDPPTLRRIAGDILGRPLPWLLAAGAAALWVFLPKQAQPPPRTWEKPR